MDFSYFDYTDEEVPATPTSQEAQVKGFQKLVEVAQNIPLLEWRYNDVDVPDTGDKIGIITQSLKNVPGLASMVQENENGIQSYDSSLLAGAALGLVAELARYVLGVKLREDYARENNGPELAEQISTDGTASTDTDINAPAVDNTNSTI